MMLCEIGAFGWPVVPTCEPVFAAQTFPSLVNVPATITPVPSEPVRSVLVCIVANVINGRIVRRASHLSHDGAAKIILYDGCRCRCAEEVGEAAYGLHICRIRNAYAGVCGVYKLRNIAWRGQVSAGAAKKCGQV